MAHIITENEFSEKVLLADKPVLVDFYAEWCGPCKMMAPILDQLSEEHGEELEVYKIDTDSCETLCETYDILSIPNMILFIGGEAVCSMVGAMSKGDLWNKIAEQIHS